MITEDYVSFETAKLLKEKGFDENCAALYSLESGDFDKRGVGYVFNNSQWDFYITAPTLQMAMKWLREVHKEPINVWYDGDVWTSELYRTTEKDFCLIGHFQTYEQACDTAIKYCLEN